MKTKAQIEYDNRRKNETKKKLFKGIADLKRLKVHETKAITKNELSKATGVTRATIDRFPEVVAKLEETNANILSRQYEVPIIDTDRIDNLEEARILIKGLINMISELQQTKHLLEQTITERDSTIANLQASVYELKDYIKATSKKSN